MGYQKVFASAYGDGFLDGFQNVDMLLADELSEEDSQLKSELEMLVERLQVRLNRTRLCFVSKVLKGRPAGARYDTLQTSARCHKELHQNFDIFYDSRSKTAEIPATSL